MKKIIVVFVFAVQFAIYSQNIRESLEEILAEPFFDTTLAAVNVYNLTKGLDEYKKNNSLLMRPASNMKVITTAAALKYLGMDFNFETRLCYDGEIEGSELKGNLYVKGGGDPDFQTSDLDDFVADVKKLGIKKINGSLIGDVSFKDSLFWGSGWMWDDDPSTDAPYLSALNINSNCITIIVTINEQGKIDITSEPETHYVKPISFLRETSTPKERITITRDYINRTNDILVKGEYEKSKALRIITPLNVYKPEFYFLQLLKEKFANEEIEIVDGLNISKLPAGAKEISKIERSFGEVIVNLNKTSDNLSAEMTLLAMGQRYSEGPASAKKGLKMIDSLIIECGFNPRNYRIEDGSGVSHYTLVSVELLTGILKYMYYEQPELQKVLEESFPNAGIDGTLKSRMKGTLAESNLRAKTGTLSGVSCLTGYVTGKGGDKYAFSIMIQNHVAKTSRAIEYQNRICEILANN